MVCHIAAPIQFEGVHHVGFIIEDKERSRKFYCDTLGKPLIKLFALLVIAGALVHSLTHPLCMSGLSVNEDRPNDKLNFDGLWLWLGPEMLHLMVVDDPDPKTGRPEHGGRDRHVCLGVTDITPVENRLKVGGIEYTKSKSGRKAVFFRDPDMNTLEVFESKPWR